MKNSIPSKLKMRFTKAELECEIGYCWARVRLLGVWTPFMWGDW